MTDHEIIEKLGGVAKVAKLVNISSPAASYWKRKGIPPLRLIQLKTLRPEIFDEETVQTVQPEVTITSD